MSYIPGPMYKTRFSELRFTMLEHGCWRFVDVTDQDNPALVGSSYPSREQIVANIERYAAEYGCEGANKTLRENHAQPKPQAATPEAALIELVLDALCAALPFVEDGEHNEVYKKGWAAKNAKKVRDAITALEAFQTGKDVCTCGAPIYGRMRVHHCSQEAH